MRRILLFLAVGLFSASASAYNSFDPSTTILPWKNGPTRDAVIDFGQHSNSVFVLEASANFCGYCKENAVNVNELTETHMDDERVLVADLSIDSQEREIRQWISSTNPNHPVLHDVGRTVWDQLKQDRYIPQVFVADCEGNLVYSHVGVWSDAVKREINHAIAEAKTVTCD